MTFPDEVLELIATHVKDNIRELEGALTRVVAHAPHPLANPLPRQVALVDQHRARPRCGGRQPGEEVLPLDLDVRLAHPG